MVGALLGLLDLFLQLLGLVITSVTLLTRKRAYWYIGLVFSLGGIASAVSVLFLK